MNCDKLQDREETFRSYGIYKKPYDLGPYDPSGLASLSVVGVPSFGGLLKLRRITQAPGEMADVT